MDSAAHRQLGCSCTAQCSRCTPGSAHVDQGGVRLLAETDCTTTAPCHGCPCRLQEVRVHADGATHLVYVLVE